MTFATMLLWAAAAGLAFGMGWDYACDVGWFPWWLCQ